ncbi:MAG TPA: hypothetical protein VF619_06755 [Allosphingosinicella sp.]
MNQKQLEMADQAARANLFLESKIEGPCRISISGRRENCNLEVLPTDKDKHITNLLVQFPQEYYQESGKPMRGTLNGGSIDIGDGLKYLVNRSYLFTGKPGSVNSIVPVPIIIYAAYEFEGKEYVDRSLYCLMYNAPPMLSGQAIPLSLLYVGRLKQSVPKIDFVIDPWIASEVGFSKEESTALAFGCPGQHGFVVHSPSGRLRVVSDVSPGEAHAPRPGRAFGSTPTGFKFFPLEGRSIRIEYWLVEIGGPTFKGLELPIR